MVVADPMNELDELLGDESEQSDSTPEEELGSKPSTSEGTRTQESTANFTRARSIDGEGTQPESNRNFTRGSNCAGEGTQPESNRNFTRASPSTGGGLNRSLSATSPVLIRWLVRGLNRSLSATSPKIPPCIRVVY